MSLAANGLTTIVACDACRIRKIKCETSNIVRNPSEVQASCAACVELNLPCRFTPRKRRAVQNPAYIRRLAEAGENLAGPSAAGPSGTSNISPSQHSEGSLSPVIYPQFSLPLGSFEMPLHLPNYSDATNPFASPSSGHEQLPAVPLFHRALTNPLDAVLPRPLLTNIIDTFFSLVYPLFPLPHRPTFLMDLASKREEKEGEEEWTNMVLALVGFTIAQAPHEFASMRRDDLRDLLRRCSNRLRTYMAQSYQIGTLNRLIITYCIGTIENNQGNHMMARMLHGGNVALALQMRLHEQETYRLMDPIEQEMSRRMFWLLYMSDRSSTCTENGNMLLNEADCLPALLPRDIDDQYITMTGIVDPPPHQDRVMTGFIVIVKLWRLAGILLHMQLCDRRIKPSGVVLCGQINEIDDLMFALEHVLHDSPNSLKPEWTGTDPSRASSTNHFANMALSPRPQDPNLSIERKVQLIHQANILVTQYLLRLICVQYRRELVRLKALERAANSVYPAYTTISAHLAARSAEREILESLLTVLHQIPIEIHAINSLPGVTKIRFIASTLLDDLSEESGLSSADLDYSTISAGTSLPLQQVDRREAAMEQLLSFLRILTTIEKLYSLADF